MLILTRKPGTVITLTDERSGEVIRVELVQTNRSGVRLALDAPKEWRITSHDRYDYSEKKVGQ